MNYEDRERRALKFSNSIDALWANDCLDEPYMKIQELEAFERGLRLGAAMGYAGREEMLDHRQSTKGYEQ